MVITPQKPITKYRAKALKQKRPLVETGGLFWGGSA
jgi:hypothetical protein